MDDFSLTDLIERCHEERARFHKGLATDPAFCLEIFRRALEEAEPSTDDNWQALVEAFTDQLQSWFYHHPSFHVALAREEAAYYINGAFIRLFEINQKQPLVFFTLPQALYYLRRCLTTVILNEIRKPASDSPPEDSIPLEQNPIEKELQRLGREEFKQIVYECLRDAEDRRLLDLRWFLGYQPADIHKLFADEFPDVKEIYRMVASLVARLKRCLQAKSYGWDGLIDLIA